MATHGRSASGEAANQHNLPASISSFVGRERELAEVRARLEQARLLTLTGVGGCGKTRLAVELARAVLRRYPDGVWFVELAPVSDPAHVGHSVAAVLSVHEKPGQCTLAALTARLRTRRTL